MLSIATNLLYVKKSLHQMLLLNLFFSKIVFTYQTRIHAHTHFQHSLQFIAHKDNKREILLHVIQSKRWNIAFGP